MLHALATGSACKLVVTFDVTYKIIFYSYVALIVCIKLPVITRCSTSAGAVQ